MLNETPPPSGASRRGVMLAAAGAAAAVALPRVVVAKPKAAAVNPSNQGHSTMPMLTSKDGAKIFYKDWGRGQPVVFSHGWPLNGDAWDNQMLFLVQHGYRVVAHDRRGHGRSEQTSDGNDMNTYADDLAMVIETLDLKDAMLVGHSTGGGEVARYLGRHGSKRVAKAVLIGAVPPTMLKTAQNPGGSEMSVFDGLRAGVAGDRSQLYRDLAVPFYGFNKPDAKPSASTIENFWLQGMSGGIKGQFDCITAFSETDFTEDLRKIEIPTLFLHGSADQIVPIDDASKLAVTLVKHGTLKIYDGAPHGMCTTQAPKVNADLLEFLKS